MRAKKDTQLHLSFGSLLGPKIVIEFQQKYNKISDILDQNPRILTLVDQDLKRLASQNKKGRAARYTSEHILRALIVMRIECLSYRDAIVRIADSDVLCDFLRLGNRTVMDYTFLNKCFNAIRAETWRQIVRVLAGFAVDNDLMDPSIIRTDTTVVESNIHYPTDSSLLWDSWRVLVRWILRAKALLPEIRHHRFHEKKAKGHHLFITRYITSPAKGRKREVKRRFKELIASVRRVHDIARQVCAAAERGLDFDLAGIASQLHYYLPAVKTVTDTAERAMFKGETVRADERVFSIFEQHAELIKRGKRGKPVEFGHSIQLTQTQDKFITDFLVMEKQIPDSKLLAPAVDAHQEQFGEYPEVVAGDCGFHGTEEVMESVRGKVTLVIVPKHVAEWKDEEMSPWQGLRAGVEGSISVLKRAFGLFRCLYRGFKNLAGSVGLSVFCHNLVHLARG